VNIIEEVSALLDEHTFATGQVFDELVKKKIYHLTAGQPWLTNALAKINKVFCLKPQQ
jgi:hypothetical protein